MTLIDSVLTTADLPYAELCAARLDGELYSLDSCFVPSDVPEYAELRARSITIAWPDRLIAEQHSAAWVLGASVIRPARHELCADIAARARPTNGLRAHIREVVIDASEITRVGELDVTTPLRTLIDLARFSASWGDEEVSIRQRLMEIGGFGPDECWDALESRRNLPGKRAAWQRISSH